MSVFEHKMNEDTKLGDNEVSAIEAFLASNVPEFETLSKFPKVYESS